MANTYHNYFVDCTNSLEAKELVQKLIDNGYGDLIKVLIDGDNKTFTKKGRLNKSGTSRELNWKNKQLEDAINDCRRILAEDYLQE